MPTSFTRQRKLRFKRLKTKKCFNLCSLVLAALPTIVFGVFTIVFTLQQDASAKAVREQDQRQADETNRRMTFQEYIDDMTALLLNQDVDANITKIFLNIRVQTLTVLQTLDVNRKHDVIVFLYENHLIQSDKLPNVDLRGANLSGLTFRSSSTATCHFPFLYLPGTSMNNVIFVGCSLDSAVFDDASLSFGQFTRCYLTTSSFVNANLTGVQLKGNNLYHASFSGSRLVRSSITGGIFRLVNLTNADLYQSDISDALLYQTPYVTNNFNTLLNTRYPNGSFSDIQEENLIVHRHSTSECYQNGTQTSASQTVAVQEGCFALTQNQSSAMQTIDIHQYSLLIDLEQAMFSLSTLVEFEYGNNSNEFLIGFRFFQCESVSDDDRLFITSKKNASLSQMEVFTDSIPPKARSLLVILLCNVSRDTGQLCVFKRVKLFVFQNTSSRP